MTIDEQGKPHQVDGCLMCAVRALTEGTPEIWNPTVEGETAGGVILRTGMAVHPFSSHESDRAPFVDLWTGGMGRIRVVGYSGHLRAGIQAAEGKVGDVMSIRFDGTGIVVKGQHEGRPYRKFTVTVTRGHH